MATSIASQLQAIKSLIKTDSEPLKRPFTRPSILFSPKEAADIDLDTILSISVSGLEVLMTKDETFRHYQNDLFSHKSKELDRELLNIEENNKINASISSYLRLLSGYLELAAALKTLEYLIRRYKIHVYNMEELILCALPYHDTHIFVRIVQLIDTGNSKWRFLESVKISGAAPPRNVIVQQCIRDRGVLEVLCNYASATKKSQTSTQVISFCTAVVIEVLGSLTAVDSDVVNRVLPYILSGLQLGSKGGLNYKAGALMIVGLLATKVVLNPNLVRSLIRSVAEQAREDAKDSTDLQSFMALIHLVQLQSVEILPKKTVDILNEIRDLSGILTGLRNEFNIDKFLAVFLDSLLEHSSSDDLCNQNLLAILENVPLKGFIDHIVTKVLQTCSRLSKKGSDSTSSELGSRTKQILVSIYKNYSFEFRRVVRKFLENTKMESKKEGSMYEIFCRMLDGNLDLSLEISDSKIWFALEHPEAEVRRSTLSGFSKVGVLKGRDFDSQRLVVIQDAILRRLQDDDLRVVQAAVNLTGLPDIINSQCLLDSFQDVLQRCLAILSSGVSDNASLAVDVAISCLEYAVLNFGDQEQYARQLSIMIFPLILIIPKTQRLNMKALDLARGLKWPIYQSLVSLSSPKKKKSERAVIVSTNVDNVKVLAETFLKNPQEYMSWLVECSRVLDLSKTLFFLVLLYSIMTSRSNAQFSAFYETCFPVLKTEWETIVFFGNVASEEECKARMPDGDCQVFLNDLPKSNVKELNAQIVICIFWRLVEAFITTAPDDSCLDMNGKWVTALQDLFVFFAAQPKHVFRKHLHYLVTKCKTSPVRFLLELFTEEGISAAVQVESLHSFALLCSLSEESLFLLLPAEFPSVLVPLSSDNQDVRIAAMSCIEELFKLCPHVSSSGRKNGHNSPWSHFLEELLGLIVQQKKLILSDRNVLPSFFTSLLGSSCHTLLVQDTIGQRFDQPTKEGILDFILMSALKLSSYAKLMILSLIKGVGSRILSFKDVELLLHRLLERREQYYLRFDRSGCKLMDTEVKVLCLLLEISTMNVRSFGGHVFEDHIIKALELDYVPSEEPAVIQPCITVLRGLNSALYSSLNTGTQEQLFRDLVFLYRSCNSDVQSAARDALLRVNIGCTIICRMLDLVLEQQDQFLDSTNGKKKKRATTQRISDFCHSLSRKSENVISFLSSLLDVLLLKKNIEDRNCLIRSLFKLLRAIFMDERWMQKCLKEDKKYITAVSGHSQIIPSNLISVQQALFLVLEDISASLVADNPQQGDFLNDFDLELLVKCAHSAKDAMIRNHIFSLLSIIAKITPDKVLDHVVDILTVAGESAVIQWDSNSQRVFEELISTVVPFWQSKTENTSELLQIFVNVLPDAAESRRLSIVLHLLRTLGESGSLGSFLVLLFRSLVSRKSLPGLDQSLHSMDSLTSTISVQWEYGFAFKLAEHYSCMIWLPALVMILQQVDVDKELFLESVVATQFILEKLQDPEVSFKLDSGENSVIIQTSLGELMEQAVLHLQLVDSRKKQLHAPTLVRKELKQIIRIVIKTITRGLLPSVYFKVIHNLLCHADNNVKRKALGLLCETLKETATIKPKHEGRVSNLSSRNTWINLDEGKLKSFDDMCAVVRNLVQNSDDHLNSSLKIRAVASIEVLATRFPSNVSIFSTCLASVTRNIPSDNLVVSCSCLKTTGALTNVLGPRALSELPSIMNCIISRVRDISSLVAARTKSGGDDTCMLLSSSEESLFMSILVALEAVVDKLGGFLNPYLGDILELVILKPEFLSSSDQRLKSKGDSVRKLIIEKIPIRLTLEPLLRIYSEALKSGDTSLSITFEMLGNLIGRMDRSSVRAYNVKIFDLCLLALDLRRHHPDSVKKIDFIEQNVINAIIVLTMKLTETMFKPLFIRSIEWSESNTEAIEQTGSTNIDRAISFYGLVNKLAENHRSLFAPFFKYLIDGCVRHLTDAKHVETGMTRKKKKMKLQEADSSRKDVSGELSTRMWHLRALVLSSLHKCFLYDTGSLKFLDSSNFQVLLKPIVSQLGSDPPASLERYPSIPSVKEVDDLLVVCLGQMAVTAGTDILWKPLNHEVLMQTRSEKLRTRVLGLRIVKYLVENLKEEYLVFLAETIPFLGELLEDVELPVKSLAQEILKEMESMSGESLRQYL